MALILVIILTHNKLAILIKQTQYSIKIPFWTRFISQFINFYLQLTFRNLVTLFNLHSKNVPGNVQFSRFWGRRALRFGIIKVYNTVQHRWFRYDVLLLKPLLKHHIFLDFAPKFVKHAKKSIHINHDIRKSFHRLQPKLSTN